VAERERGAAGRGVALPEEGIDVVRLYHHGGRRALQGVQVAGPLRLPQIDLLRGGDLLDGAAHRLAAVRGDGVGQPREEVGGQPEVERRALLSRQGVIDDDGVDAVRREELNGGAALGRVAATAADVGDAV